MSGYFEISFPNFFSVKMVLSQLKSYPKMRYVVRKHVSVIPKILNVTLNSDRISFQTLGSLCIFLQNGKTAHH